MITIATVTSLLPNSSPGNLVEVIRVVIGAGLYIQDRRANAGGGARRRELPKNRTPGRRIRHHLNCPPCSAWALASDTVRPAGEYLSPQKSTLGGKAAALHVPNCARHSARLSSCNGGMNTTNSPMPSTMATRAQSVSVLPDLVYPDGDSDDHQRHAEPRGEGSHRGRVPVGPRFRRSATGTSTTPSPSRAHRASADGPRPQWAGR